MILLEHDKAHFQDTINQKNQQIAFLEAHIAQLTQSISQLSLKPGEEEIKKKSMVAFLVDKSTAEDTDAPKQTGPQFRHRHPGGSRPESLRSWKGGISIYPDVANEQLRIPGLG